MTTIQKVVGRASGGKGIRKTFNGYKCLPHSFHFPSTCPQGENQWIQLLQWPKFSYWTVIEKENISRSCNIWATVVTFKKILVSDPGNREMNTTKFGNKKTIITWKNLEFLRGDGLGGGFEAAWLSPFEASLAITVSFFLNSWTPK